MKKIIRLAFVVLILFIFNYSSNGQIISYPVSKMPVNKSPHGFFYTLPKHSVKIEVKVTKTEKFKGKYADFATKLLGITDPITKDAVTYDINSVKISTITQVDSSQIYFAEIPSKISNGSQFMINLTEEGFISGFSTISNDDKHLNNNRSSGTPFQDILKPVQIERVDTIIRKVSIDTSVFVEKVPRRTISEKSNDQQAREIAEQIYKIEDSKYKLITGYQEVNYTSETVELMLKNLNSLEDNYLAHFKGSTINTESSYTFFYTPEVSGNNLYTLFKFSSTEGIISRDNPGGDPVNVSLKSLNIYSSVKDAENERSKFKSRGIYYRIPDLTNVDVNLGGRILASEKLRISQSGILTFLPPDNISHVGFDKNGSISTLIIE